MNLPRVLAVVLLLLLIPVVQGYEAATDRPADRVTPGASTAADAVTLPVRVDGVVRTVTFYPDDPRAPHLRASDPDYAGHLFVADFPGAAAFHLVRDQDSAAAVLAFPDRTLFLTLAGGVLVPAADTQLAGPDGHADEEVQIIDEEILPDDLAQPVPTGNAVDGVLQLRLVADHAYWDFWNDNWDDYQLAVIHLVEAYYLRDIQIQIEVVDQVAWTTPDPFTGDAICGSNPATLRQVRDHYEATEPTRQNAWELTHVFDADSHAGSVIGCAYIRALETAWSYGVSEIRGPGVIRVPTHRDVTLVAHEIGHNFYGLHSRAIPTPGSTADLAGCLGPITIMYPCLGPANLGVFSIGPAAAGGGNIPLMRGYANGRI